MKLQRPKARGGSQAAYTSNRLVHNPLFHHLSNKINLFQPQLLNRTSHLPTKIAADTVNILRYPYPAHQPNTKKSRTTPPPNYPFFPLQYQATLSPSLNHLRPLPSLPTPPPTTPHPPPQPTPPSKLKNHHSSTYLHPCIIPITRPVRCLSHPRNEQCFELPLLFQTCSGFFWVFFWYTAILDYL